MGISLLLLKVGLRVTIINWTWMNSLDSPPPHTHTALHIIHTQVITHSLTHTTITVTTFILLFQLLRLTATVSVAVKINSILYLQHVCTLKVGGQIGYDCQECLVTLHSRKIAVIIKCVKLLRYPLRCFITLSTCYCIMSFYYYFLLHYAQLTLNIVTLSVLHAFSSQQ